jgi:hypothetical protein
MLPKPSHITHLMDVLAYVGRGGPRFRTAGEVETEGQRRLMRTRPTVLRENSAALAVSGPAPRFSAPDVVSALAGRRCAAEPHEVRGLVA